MKFRLGGDHGLDVLGAGAPTVQAIECATGVATDEIEQTVTARASTLTYDTATQTYTYAWKTNPVWAGTCRRPDLVLADQTHHTADFKLR